ncbi:MAG: NAD-dependent deacylase [Anaerolineae bacterium]|nr:NAD-dependent deacylase [Anaerolineae bacterium]
MVILTGAGVSKESGVPTFRDAIDGLWAKYDPQQLATKAAFQANPKLVWDWYEYRRSLVRQAQPNPGHTALAALERRSSGLILITQNVDDLHERAGSQNIIHLHGNIAQSKCFFDCQGSPTIIDIAQITWDQTSGPPPCPHCGRWVRPDVVWFGEMLPQLALDAADHASRTADLMLVIGTSGLVEPAASLPRTAQAAGAKVVEINPDTSMLSSYVDLKLTGASGVILPQIIEALNHA